MTNEQEVQVQTWDPGKGNPTPRGQVHCCGLPRLYQSGVFADDERAIYPPQVR